MLASTGTNPKIYANSAIVAFVSPYYYYMLESAVNGNFWSNPFVLEADCIKQASDIEQNKLSIAKAKKKRN